MRRHLVVLALIAPVVGAALLLSQRRNEPTNPLQAKQPVARAAGKPLTSEQGIRQAALLIVQMEEQESDMGGPDFKRRYKALLHDEEPLRLAYDAIKRERAARK